MPKVTETITCNIDGLGFGYYETKNETVIFVRVDPNSQGSLLKAADALGCTDRLIESIAVTFNVILEALHNDLVELTVG